MPAAKTTRTPRVKASPEPEVAPTPVEEAQPTPSRRRRTVDEIEAQPKPARQRVTADHDALIARKKEAGLGRRQEPGTAFGSRWTDDERRTLRALVAEHGQEEGIVLFLADHKHRTPAGAAYQLAKGAK